MTSRLLIVIRYHTVCDKTKLLGLSQNNKKKQSGFKLLTAGSWLKLIKIKGASAFGFSAQEL